jgi:hypothetical protein
MTETVKYPNITVHLVGFNGNAFLILGRVQQAMRREGLSPDQIREYYEEATSGDYDHLIQTTMKYVNVD